jgi:hypothetical protein
LHGAEQSGDAAAFLEATMKARAHSAMLVAACVAAFEPTVAGGIRKAAPVAAAPIARAPADPAIAAAGGSWLRARAADRTCLGGALGARERTFVLGARVVGGASGPALEYYSYGETGLVPSFGRYWPASTLKLAAAVAALEAIRERGFDRDAVVDLEDADGPFEGTVEELVWLALGVSDNAAYNRLARLSGFDGLEVRLRSWGLDDTTIQRAYTEGERAFTLREPRHFTIREGARGFSFAEARGTAADPSCPNESNCTSLADLVELLRRVALASELPSGDRLALAPSDRDTLVDAMRAAKSRMRSAAVRVLGDAIVYGKTGSVPDNERLDHVFIDAGDERYFLAISVPYEEPDETVAELAEHALRALRDRCRGAPPVESANELVLYIRDGRLVADGAARYWVDSFEVDGPPPAVPDHLYTVVRVEGERPIAHRAVRIRE